jgi:tetratricopeptide (TPR) repeat protein
MLIARVFLPFLTWLFLATLLFLPVDVWALSPAALEWHQKARNAIGQGRYPQAEADIRQAITFDSYDPLLFITLGEIYQKQGLVDQAIQAYDRAAQLDAKDPAIYFSLGTLYEQKQDYPSAQYNYEVSQQKNPSYTYVESRLARLLGFQKKYDLAIAKYEAYLDQAPRDFEAHTQLARFAVVSTRPEQAQLAIEHLLYVKKEAPALYKDEAILAKAYLRLNDPKSALAELASATENGRYSTEVANLQSVAHEALGNLTIAIKDLKVAAESNPEDANFQYRLAFLSAKQNQYTDALKYLTRYLTLNPSDVNARVTQVSWLNRQGSYVTAKNVAQQLLTQEKLNEEQTLELSTQQAFAALKTNEYKMAADLYENVLNATPKTEENYRTLQQNLGVALYQSGQLQKALDVFQDLLASNTLEPAETTSIKKDVYHIFVKKGQLAGEEKDFESAKNWLVQAKPFAQSTNDLQELRLELGALYLEHQYNAEAIALYEEALAQEPSNIEAGLNLASLWKESDPLKAIALLDNVLKQPNVAEEAKYKATFYKASAFIQLNRKAEALPLLESLKASALSAKPKALSTEGWLALGSLYHEKKLYPQAEQAYQQAVNLDAQNALASYNLGSVYLAQKDYGKARVALLQAIQGEAPVVQAFYALGLVEESSQHNAKAIEYFQEYLNRAGDLPMLSKEKVQAKVKRLSSTPSAETPLKPVATKPDASSAKSGRLPLQ